MKVRKQEYTNTVEILASKDYQAIPIKVAVPSDAAQNGYVVKAGTPLTAAGAATTGAGAVGILLYDVDTEFDKNPSAAIVVQGIINSTKAQAHSGVTYVSALYAALPGVVFRDNIGVQSDNSSGQNDNSSGQNDNSGGQSDNSSGQNDNSSGQNDNSSGQNDNSGGQDDNGSGQEANP